jgi:hypothetical protein
MLLPSALLLLSTRYPGVLLIVSLLLLFTF